MVCWKQKNNNESTARRREKPKNVPHAKEAFGNPEDQMNPHPTLVVPSLMDSTGSLKDHILPPPAIRRLGSQKLQSVKTIHAKT
jgi:hypothetical protein